MINFHDAQKAVDGLLFLSAATQFEYDCMEEQSRMLSLANYSGNLGNGDVDC